jgi:hypothetical protein
MHQSLFPRTLLSCAPRSADRLYAPPPPRTCREYQTTATINGGPGLAAGTACMQAPGALSISHSGSHTLYDPPSRHLNAVVGHP